MSSTINSIASPQVGFGIINWIFTYILNAGHVLTVLIAFILPHLLKNNIMPYFYHPHRYGGVPFKPPSFFEYQSFYYFLIFCILSGMYILAGFMAIYKVCDRPPYLTYYYVLYNLTKFIPFLIICLIVLLFFPMVKMTMLTVFSFLPYANDICNGILWAIFSLLGLVWANLDTIQRVCGINPYTDFGGDDDDNNDDDE